MFGKQIICHHRHFKCSAFSFTKIASWIFQNIKMKKAKKRTGYLLSFNILHLAMSWNARTPRLAASYCFIQLRMPLLNSQHQEEDDL